MMRDKESNIRKYCMEDSRNVTRGDSDGMYKVIDVFPVGDNSSVTVEGKGSSFQNDMYIRDENNRKFKLLNVAMMGRQKAENIGEMTTLLIEGKFNSKIIK